MTTTFNTVSMSQEHQQRALAEPPAESSSDWSTESSTEAPTDSSDDEPEEVVRYVVPRSSRLPVHGILHMLRGMVEGYHRARLNRQTVDGLGPPYLSLDSVSHMRAHNIESCCNKSVPIYCLPHESMWAPQWYQHFRYAVQNYLYRRWFVPYRSEIDWGQFLAQIIVVHSTPAPLPAERPAIAATRLAVSLSRDISEHVTTMMRKIGDGIARVTNFTEANSLRAELGFQYWEMLPEPKFLSVQPLFRAVAVVLRQTDYSTALPSISELPALIVRTGVEEGLSAPISFESIAGEIKAYHRLDDSIHAVETSFSTAVGFIMDLEKREVAAFGPKPDPAKTCKELRRSLLLGELEAWHWAGVHGWEGDEAPEGPSSSWVDHNIYREWTGEGAKYDEFAQRQERRLYEAAAAAERGEGFFLRPPRPTRKDPSEEGSK